MIIVRRYHSDSKYNYHKAAFVSAYHYTEAIVTSVSRHFVEECPERTLR